MTKLRAGLIGLGAMGRHHCRVLQQISGVDLVGVVDPGGDNYAAAGKVPVLREVGELLELGIDYAMVATPTIYHEPIGLQLAGAGVHAMIEKPLAPDVESAQRLVAAFAQAGLVGAVGHIERFNPALQSLRGRLANGDLGDLYQVSTRRLGPFPPRIADVGVIMDLATHDIDLTAWITGAQYTSVTAHVAYKSGRTHEDLVSMIATLADGTITNHQISWLYPTKERLTIVTGERGAFVADTLTADLTYFANGTLPTAWDQIATFRGVSEGDIIRYALNKPEPLRTEHEAFRDAVLGEQTDIVTLEQGLRTVAVAQAALTSAQTSATVTL